MTRKPEPGRRHQLWGSRFTTGLAPDAEEFNRSLPVDHRLWPYDLRASRAWARALERAGVLNSALAGTILSGLDAVEQRLSDGAATGAPDEDVHTLIERLLYEAIGEPAGMLNAGRSRNDQVATDFRLWCRDAVRALDDEVVALVRALGTQARAGIGLLLPGYTHGQRAQPVRWAHVLLAHTWPLVRDRDRLADAMRRCDEMPLGASALAGSGVPIERDWLCRELEFAKVSPNALDATGDRDFATDLVYAMTMLAQHVSRLAGEIALYASSEFGFVRVADGYVTGSSLMPQKRNPDILELARGKASRIQGDLVVLTSLPRGLAAGYGKDLQEDKAPTFDAVDQMLLTLPPVRGVIETMEPRADRMQAALDPSMLATDLADGLVGHGVPFREAHRIVGELVRFAEGAGAPVTAVPASEAAKLHPVLPQLIDGLGSWEDSVERRATAGGSSRRAVEAQLSEIDRLVEAAKAGEGSSPAFS